MLKVDGEALAQRYRESALDLSGRRLLLTNLLGTQQEKDLTLPPNCDGFGRIHHFYRLGKNGFPSNPLPIDPALNALGLPYVDTLRVQVFQSSVCNWRCWYCFVPFNLLRGDHRYSRFVSSDELIELYIREKGAPRIIDLSGGQPELTPEWVYWILESVEKYGLADSVYIWSDDNLSNDYYWKYLSKDQRERIARFKNYGRVGCFKGFDAESFIFNTGSESDSFNNQLDLMNRYIRSGIDMYGYVTLTTPSAEALPKKMSRFMDSLQNIHENLPLRIIPLEIRPYSSNISRINGPQENAIANQYRAIECWNAEIQSRFSNELRNIAIQNIDIGLKIGR